MRTRALPPPLHAPPPPPPFRRYFAAVYGFSFMLSIIVVNVFQFKCFLFAKVRGYQYVLAHLLVSGALVLGRCRAAALLWIPSCADEFCFPLGSRNCQPPLDIAWCVWGCGGCVGVWGGVWGCEGGCGARTPTPAGAPPPAPNLQGQRLSI